MIELIVPIAQPHSHHMLFVEPEPVFPQQVELAIHGQRADNEAIESANWRVVNPLRSSTSRGCPARDGAPERTEQAGSRTG